MKIKKVEIVPIKDGTWHLEPHDKRHFRTTQISIVYNPEASAPRFEQFLDEIFEGDKDAESGSLKRLKSKEVLMNIFFLT